ncbi:MAG: hypothetical protein ACUVRL_02240 [Candidatus Saccharicenans sp.]|uniref:hypothetical protein n=1 Tax=Candidatus Saccharicenans sp. TaxID=2819258 RepID=UPI00404A7D4A
MAHQPARPAFPAAPWILLAISIFFLSCPLRAQSGRFWQLTFKLQIQGDFRPAASGTPAGSYWLESEWCGFLEEDGLDFIIYPLGSATSRWQLTIERQGSGPSIPKPKLKLDYIEGQEEDIVFYFSFQPEIVGWTLDSTYKGSIVLPSLPWLESAEKIPGFKRRIIQGDRNLSLVRSLLARNEIRREFSWDEETTFQNSGPAVVKQRSRVRVILELIRCQLRSEVRPGGENGRKSVSAFPG